MTVLSLLLTLLLSLWDKLLRLFGTSEQQLRWKQHLRERERENRSAGRKNAARHVTYRHKNCDACGRLVDRDATECPYCEAKLASWQSTVGRRALDTFLPGSGALTSLLLMANGGLYLAMVLMTGNVMDQTAGDLAIMGANFGPLLLVEWWRLVTYAFLHGGLMHIAFNLYALAVIGPLVEEHYGSARAWIIYFGSAVAGGLASHLYNPIGVSVGASGALMGLMGAGVIVGHLSGTARGRYMRDQLFRWFVFTALFGLMVRGIDNAAHFGGFFAGIGLGAGLSFSRRLSEREVTVFRVVAGVLAALTLLALVLMVAARLSDPPLP